MLQVGSCIAVNGLHYMNLASTKVIDNNVIVWDKIEQTFRIVSLRYVSTRRGRPMKASSLANLSHSELDADTRIKWFGSNE